MEKAKGLVNTAKATGDTNERSHLAVQFNELLGQIDFLANDSSFNGTNLIRATPDNLKVDFNEAGDSDLTITGLDSTTVATGLNITTAANNLADIADINTSLTQLDNALMELRSNAGAADVLGKIRSQFRTFVT